MLAEENWIRQRQSNNRYTLGYRTLRLGHAMRRYGLQSALIQGIVANLAYNLGHSACVAAYQGDCFVIVAKSEIYNSYHFIDVFAPNTDWIINSMGQFLLAHQPEKAAERVYREHFGIEVPEAHWTLFETIRRDGYLVRQEGAATRFVTGIEDPITGQIRNVISVVALNAHAIDGKKILSELKSKAAEVSKRLSGRQYVPAEYEEIS
jgi:DNA-binding IclR family transcriptional regulator